MSKSAYPLKMPKSVKDAAARLAKADGVSLNQFIAVAVAEKVGTVVGDRNQTTTTLSRRHMWGSHATRRVG